MRYREYPPTAALAACVQCLWTLEGHATELGGESQPVLPDGRPELIVHFGDAFERVDADAQARPQPLRIFAGQLPEALTLRPTGRVAVLGIRFHPCGAAALVTLPLRDATGVTAPLGDISTTLDRALIEVRESAASLEDAVGRASRALERLFRPDRVDRRVRYAVELIATARGRVPIETVAARTGMTRRHLERRFSEDVGLSPKRLARIARFQHALRVLDDVPAAGRGTTTAAECGYADQAHFIREFRSLAGCAPGSHLLRRAELTEFFIRRE